MRGNILVDIVGALKKTFLAVTILVATVATVTIGALVNGAIAQVGASGNVSVPATIETFLNSTWLTSIVSVFTSVGTTLTTIVSLLIVAALMIIFGLKLGFGGKGGGNSM